MTRKIKKVLRDHGFRLDVIKKPTFPPVATYYLVDLHWRKNVSEGSTEKEAICKFLDKLLVEYRGAKKERNNDK